MGLRNLPLNSFAQNRIWCQTLALAREMTAWMGLLGYPDQPARTWEPKRLRHRFFQIPAALARHARQHDEVYPTYWLRLWFMTPAGKCHQRGYTLVDPDPASDTAWIEFCLHPGVASDWARAAQPGDRIDATVLNSRPPSPLSHPTRARIPCRPRHCAGAWLA